MSTLDVRTHKVAEVTEILFSDSSASGFSIAHKMTLHPADSNLVRIQDGMEFVLIANEEHARNLIMALETAINIGWLK